MKPIAASSPRVRKRASRRSSAISSRPLAIASFPGCAAAWKLERSKVWTLLRVCTSASSRSLAVRESGSTSRPRSARRSRGAVISARPATSVSSALRKLTAVAAHCWLSFAYCEWQSWQRVPGVSPTSASLVFTIPCLPWQVSHSGHLWASNAILCLLPSKSIPFWAWQRRQICATLATAGGIAAWLPWHPVQVGAPRSPFTSSALPWTLSLYCATWLVGSGVPSARRKPSMRFASE